LNILSTVPEHSLEIVLEPLRKQINVAQRMPCWTKN
jgi:hypothetical protein